MFVVLIFILLLVGAAVIGSIYSNFLVFYSNFSESENYHRAYYASISALERGELVTKQRQPGYVGSGGFVMGSGQGSRQNGGSDRSLTGFSYFGDNEDETTVFWTINSLTDRIPATGNGDVESMLSTGDSENYNMMGYENAEVFLLYADNSVGNPYVSGSVDSSLPDSIKGEIRLPVFLSGKFGPLDINNVLFLQNNSLPKDDAIVDWQIRGDIIGGDLNSPFTIYSTPSIEIGGRKVNYNSDTVFRESDINGGLKFNFRNNNWSPIVSNTRGVDSTNPTIISQYEQNIKDSLSESFNLNGLFFLGGIENIQLRFSLLNLVQGTGNNGTNVYPFLEYYIDFGGKKVPDKYYTITAEGNYKDYNVDIVIKKPTVKETILGSFTSIF